MADRKNCTHSTTGDQVIVVRWCARCSGWRVSRLGELAGSASGSSSLELFENHFLPQEETSPEQLNHLIQRAFLFAQELSDQERARRVY